MNKKFVLLMFCTLMSVMFAGQSTAQDGLRLEQAIIRVLENNPELKIADYEAQAMAARMRQAIQAPADRIGFTLENFAGTGDKLAVRGIDTTLSLSRTLELGNKAALRGDLVQAETLLTRSRHDIDRLHLLADTAQQFLHVVADQERLHLTEESIDLIRLTENAVEARIRAGRTAEVERQRIVIDLANKGLELEHRRHELENSRVRLATFWNERRPDYERVVADIFKLDELPDFDSLVNLLDQNPELTSHVRAEDLARARLRLEQGRQRPDVDVAAGVRYLGSSNDFAFMLSASIPLGSNARARPGIDEAEALSQLEPLRWQQRKQELYATLFQVYQEITHAREAVITLRERIIPATENMLTEYDEGYRAGRYSLLEFLQIQQLLQQGRSRLLEMAINFHNYRIELDRLTGAQLSQW
jgi:cobalt-zinc-cadmium efflux system outer membrane protein